MAGGTYTIFVAVDASGAITQLRQVGNALGTVQAKAKETGSVFGGMFKFFALEQAIRQIYDSGDAFLKVKSDMSIAGFEGEKLWGAIDRIGEVANKTRQPMDRLSEVYRQMAIISHNLGISQEDMFTITRGVGEALALAGTTAGKAQNGIIQLSHAFEAAYVQGQTFNNLQKDMPLLLNAMAASMGKGITQLKEMQKAGEITGKMFAQLAIKATPLLDARFGKSVITFSQAFVVLKNNIVLAIAQMDHATGGFTALAASIVYLAGFARTIAPFFVNMSITLLALRIGLAAYAATTTVASAATMIFGKSVLDAKDKLIAARVIFAGTIGVFVLLATAILQFGDKVKLNLGPIKSLDQLFRNLVSAIVVLVGRIVGLKGTIILLTTVFIAMKTEAYGVVGIFGVVIAVLVRMHASLGQWVAALTVAGAAIVLFGGNMKYAYAVTFAFNLLVGTLKLGLKGLELIVVGLRAAFIALGLAELFASGPIGLIVAGVVALGVAFGVLVAYLPGLEGIKKWALGLIQVGWDWLATQLGKIWNWLDKISHGLLTAFKNALLMKQETADSADAAKDLEKEVEKVANWAGVSADAMKKFNKEAKDALQTVTQMNKGSGFQQDNIPGTGGLSPADKVAFDRLTQAGISAADALNEVTGASMKAAAALNSDGTSGKSHTGSASMDSWEGTKGTFMLGNWLAQKTQQSAPGGGYTTGIGQGNPAWGPAQAFDAQPEVQAQVDKLNKIYDAMKQSVQNTGLLTLTNQQLQLLKLQTGATGADIAQVRKDNAAILKQEQKIYEVNKKAADEAAKAQAAQQLREQQTQAYNQSVAQLTLQALNAFGVNNNSDLPSQVRELITQIANMQKGLVGITDPIQQAQAGRQVQILTDSLNKLTGAVQDNTAAQNPYTKYAQNVYGTNQGIAGAASAGVAQGSGPPGSALYMGSFADGGSIGIHGDGLYAANLHAGEQVRISKKESNDRPVVLNMVVNGVQDTEGFRRSKKQIMTSMYRALMAAGAQS